jgi:hypothetical protein
LIAFKTALSEVESKLPEADRQLGTAEGPVTLREATEKELIVEQKGVKKLIPWDAVPDADLFRVARQAFAGQSVERQLSLVAFAFAHRLRDAFFEAALDVELSADASSVAPLLGAWKERIDARMATPVPPSDGGK